MPFIPSNWNTASTEGAPIQALLLQRNNLNNEAIRNLGQLGGAVAGGAAGGIEGFQNPDVFGAGTTPAGGALKGAALNLAAYAGGGNGGGGKVGMGRLINGGDDDASDAPAPSPGGMTFKQLQQLGKSADAYRNALKLGATAPTGDDDPKVLGATDDEWATKGALEKFQTVGATVKAQAQQSLMQEMAARSQQLQEAAANKSAQSEAMTALPTFAKSYQARIANGETAAGASLNALGDVKVADPRTAKALLSFYQQIGAGDGVSYSEDPVSGARFATHGNTMMPSGSNVSKISGSQVKFMTGPDGKPIGYSWLGGSAKNPTTQTKLFSQMTDKDKAQLAFQNETAIENLQGKIAALGGGLPNLAKEYDDEIGQHRAAKLALEGNQNPPVQTPTATPSGGYSSKDDVVAAFKSGKLSRAAAAQILTQQFGVPNP